MAFLNGGNDDREHKDYQDGMVRLAFQFQDSIMLPFPRNIVGRTLYEDMVRMEDLLTTCDDIEWTIIRSGRLRGSLHSARG